MDGMDSQAAELARMFERMLVIRRFEEHTAELYARQEVPGFVHVSIGQEATAVGACWPLDRADVIVSNHRGHGHCLAKGMDPGPMFAELMGRESGSCKGRGGSMHIADPSMGVFGANGIVGAGLPIAVGAATAAQLRGERTVVVAFFGDGAVAQGAFHEALNLAAVWDLPVLFLCENNHYAEFSPSSTQHRATLADRALGYGVEHAQVDGNDVEAVAAASALAVERLRAGEGPLILEAMTYRRRGHYEGDPELYRDPAEVLEAEGRDPIALAERRLLELGTSAHEIARIRESVEQQIDDALARARASSFPDPSTLADYVSDTSRDGAAEPTEPDGSEEFKTLHAIRAALEIEMTEDPSVFMAGIDIGLGGNVFGLFRGLHEQFPGRVRDTPISETAIVGTAVGAAMAGMKPVVEIMYMDFIGVCFDQILNQAAKLRFMTAGAAPMSLVIRTQIGAGRSSASQHSQSLEAILAHVPGLRVVMPSSPADAYGLLRAAIQDPNPVIFVENRLLYGQKGPKPPADYVLPIGRAHVVRAGSDVTIVSWSRMLHAALAAADELVAEGIDAEVIDLRTIVPLDRATILESLAKTSRLVIAHEAVRDFGVGAEIAALAVDEGFCSLDAPVLRVAPPAVPAPYSPALEAVWLPDGESIKDAVRRSVAF